MDASESLRQFRDGVPGCHVAAFVDLSSKMVLAVNARSKLPQEQLDALAERAAVLFATPDAVLSDATTAEQASAEPDFVLALSAINLEAFVRADRDATEALGLICSTEVDVEQLLRHGDVTLAAIETGA